MASSPPEHDPRLEIDRKRARVQVAKRWIRRARWVLAGALVLVGVYAFLSFRLYTIDAGPQPGADTSIDDVKRGDTLLLMNLNLWRDPKAGDIVFYDHPAPDSGKPEVLIGRIAGLPGETVRRIGPTVAVGERGPLSVGFGLGPNVKVKDGDVIPDGAYLIVTDTDALAYADSRDFGYIARDAISRKVVMNLAPMLGQRDLKQPD